MTKVLKPRNSGKTEQAIFDDNPGLKLANAKAALEAIADGSPWEDNGVNRYVPSVVREFARLAADKI